jgi:hypothetical protein
MLPEMAAPGAEMRPSLIVRVEELDGSQLPLLVTTVTFHWPSNGCPAKAGVAAVTAKRVAQISGRMRLRRMNQVPQLGMARLIGEQCGQTLVRCNNQEDS